MKKPMSGVRKARQGRNKKNLFRAWGKKYVWKEKHAKTRGEKTSVSVSTVAVQKHSFASGTVHSDLRHETLARNTRQIQDRLHSIARRDALLQTVRGRNHAKSTLQRSLRLSLGISFFWNTVLSNTETSSTDSKRQGVGCVWSVVRKKTVQGERRTRL